MTRYNESMRDHNHYTCCYLNCLESYLKNAHHRCRVIYLMPVKMTMLKKLCMTIGWESTVDELCVHRDGMIVTLMVTSLFTDVNVLSALMIIMMTYAKYSFLCLIKCRQWKYRFYFLTCYSSSSSRSPFNSIKTASATTMILCNRKIWWDENWVLFHLSVKEEK